MARKVLLSYMERNKPVTIPEEQNDGHVDFLRQEFLKNFYYSKNVRLNVTFQRFDLEWNEYVDLEDDATVHNKDKLKVIVSPCLTDTSKCSTEEPSEVTTITHANRI